MGGSTERVGKAFAHEEPDRTPLFEIFQPCHPVYWEVCGHTVGTDHAMVWDAMADGIAWEELYEATVQAQYAITKHFGLDMVRLAGAQRGAYTRPVKTGKTTWTLNGIEHQLNERTKLVEVAHPAQAAAYSKRRSEGELLKELEEWDGSAPEPPAGGDPVLKAIQKRAEADGLDWVYMAEIGAGTGAAFYPPFLLMWTIEKPELLRRWIEKQKLGGFARTRWAVANGCSVIAMGGDVSCDKGPFISPAHYREFILPVIQEHISLIHDLGAKAVYTSDGNHWAIKDEMFFQSGADGYKEVDKAAGMTWPRLIEEGVAERVRIVGNMDARYTLCQGTTEQVKAEVIECLTYGQRTPGGHIIHASHSVHEDVKPQNYRAMIDAYREFFGLEKLPR